MGRLDEGRNILTYCCGKANKQIAVSISDNPAETIDNYIERRNEIINEGKRVAQTGDMSDNPHYNACLGCPDFIEHTWSEEDFQFHYVCYGVSPAPCQAKCIYCSSNLENRRRFDVEQDGESHALVFKHMQYFHDNGLLASDVQWEIGAGEITVHPYREEVYRAVGDHAASWLSNCFIYSEQIAKNLANNAESNILFSMDAGTDATWTHIKGVDNFSHVKENIKKYVQATIKPEQMMLKYLVLPSVNDDEENLINFIRFVKDLNLKGFLIAKDRWAQTSQALLRAVVILIVLASQNGLSFGFKFFTPDEIKTVEQVLMSMKR